MTTLDKLEDLLRKGEKEKAYELIIEDKSITAETLLAKSIYFAGEDIQDLSISIAYIELAEKISENGEFCKAAARRMLPISYNGRGTAYYKLKQYEKALDDYDKALELDPENAEAYYRRGNAYHDLNQHKRAFKDYDKAIELSPTHVEAYLLRGGTYCDLKQYEEAIRDYNKAIKLNPNRAEAYILRGYAYCDLKQCEEAIRDYNKAIKLNPNRAEAYYLRGNAYRELNQDEEAIKDYSKAIELNPKYAEAYNNRGIILFLTNEDLDQAIEDLKYARFFSEGKEKGGKLTGLIEWAKARKAMNMKNWDTFRKRMNEAREIFKKIDNYPYFLSLSMDAFIKFSFVDEELDNALKIHDPIEASKKIENALNNFHELEVLVEPERTIFGARISSFAILSEFIGSMRRIDDTADLGRVKDKLTKLFEDSKEAEEKFESVNFVRGKTAIVDIQDVISSVKEEIGKIGWAANKKQRALDILKNYWSRLSSAIKVMNGISTLETENITLGREIKSELRVGFAETKEIISKGFEKSSEEHKEILEKIYETKNILLQKDVVNARYRIEIPPPPSPAKIIVDIPIGKLTEKQIEEKAKEVADKIKNLRGKVKKEFLEAIKRIPEMGDKLLKRLKKTKG